MSVVLSGMGNGNTIAVAPSGQLEYRKCLGAIMIQRGETYVDIRKATGLSPGTISGIKKGIVKTNLQLIEELKKNEHNDLAQMGYLARNAATKRLVDVLVDDDGSIPLSQVLKAQEVAFQQRRTLEGEASIIIDHGAMRLSADQRRSRLDELQARLDEIEAREREVIDVDVDPG